MSFSRFALAGILAALPFWMEMNPLYAADQTAAVQDIDPTDLWGLWRSGFEKYEEAENAAKKASGQDQALRLYQEAKALFEAIRRQNPSWNREVIVYRITLCNRKIESIAKPKRDAMALVKKQKEETAKAASEEIAQLKKQLRQARLEVLELKNKADHAAKNEAQIKELLAERQKAESQVTSLQIQIESLRRKLAAADRSSEYKKQLVEEKARAVQLNKKIRNLEFSIQTLKLEKSNLSTTLSDTEKKLYAEERKNRDMSRSIKAGLEVAKEKAELEGKLQTAQAELTRLRGEQTKTMSRVDELQNQIARIRSGKESSPAQQKLEHDLLLAKRENDMLKSRSTELGTEIASLKKAKAIEEAERRQLAVELARAVAAQNRLQNALAEARTAQTSLQSKRNADILQAAALRKEADTLKKELSALAAKHEELRKTAAKASSVSEALIREQDRSAALKKQTEELTKQNQQIQAELAEFRKGHQNSAVLQKNSDELQKKLNTLTEKEAALRKELDSRTKSHQELSAQVELLRKELNSAQNQCRKMEQELAGKAKTAPAVLPERKEDPAKIKASAEASAAEAASLRKELAAAQEKTRKLESELAKKTHPSPAPVQTPARKDESAELAAARKEAADLKKRQAAAEASHRTELDNLERKNLELRGQVENLRKDATKAAQEDLRKLTDANTRLKEEKDRNETAIRQLTQLRNTIQLQNKNLEQELELARKELTELRKTQKESLPAAEVEKKTNQLMDRLAASEKNRKDLEQSLQKHSKRSEELERELKTVRSDLDSSRKSAERYQNELKRWTDDPGKGADTMLKRKDEAIDALVKDGEDLRKELSVLKTELVMSRDEIRRLKKIGIGLANNMQKLKAENLRLKQNASAQAPAAKKAAVKPQAPAAKKAAPTAAETEKASADLLARQTNEPKFKEAFRSAEEAEKNGDTAGALMNYWRAVDAKPNSVEAHLGLARIYLKRGEKSSAAKAYAKARELGAPEDKAMESKLKGK